MNVTDLMIGDLVQFDEDTCVVEELRVDGTAVVTSLNTDLTSIDGDQVDVEELYPIPLTEDILVKNGFYRSPRWHYCEITIGNFLIHVQLGCGGKIDYVDITSKLSNALARKEIDMTTHINYVHQLQHLLRLCGIEKEFEL